MSSGTQAVLGPQHEARPAESEEWIILDEGGINGDLITQAEYDVADGQYVVVEPRSERDVQLSTLLALKNGAMDLDAGEATAFDELTRQRSPRLAKPLPLD